MGGVLVCVFFIALRGLLSVSVLGGSLTSLPPILGRKLGNAWDRVTKRAGLFLLIRARCARLVVFVFTCFRPVCYGGLLMGWMDDYE